MPDNITYTSNLPQLAAKFEEYLRYNTRSVKELMEHKAGDIAIHLFKATPVVKLDDIQRKLEELGWQVRRKYSGHAKKGESSADALIRMHQSIAQARFKHAKYMASGWLPAVRRFHRDGEVTIHEVANPRGRVDVHLDGNHPYIAIINSTPGIAVLESARPFVESVIQYEIADMDKYIARKQKEGISIFNPTGKR